MDVPSQSVEQARQQIQDLLNGLEQLAQGESGDDEFFNDFLNRVVTGLAAVGGVIWKPNQTGALDVAYQVNLADTHLPVDPVHEHSRLIQHVFASRTGRWVGTPSTGDDEASQHNPTPFLLLLAPILEGDQTVGVVEIVQRPVAEKKARTNYQRLLERMSQYAGMYLKNRELRDFKKQKQLWGSLERFQQSIHSSLDVRSTAYAVANEGRQVVGCDRLTVVTQQGGKLKVAAVSGQDWFDERSSAIRSLVQLAGIAAKSNEPLWYPASSGQLPPHLEEMVENYVDQAESTTLAVLPMMDDRGRGHQSENDKRVAPVKHRTLVGALIAERFEGENPPGFEHRMSAVCDAASVALANSIEHQGVFMLPVWQSVGTAGRAMKTPKAVIIALAIVAAIAALFVIPADFEMKASGELQPVLRNDVFAAADGIVSEIKSRHGDNVKAKQLLLKMESNDLDSELARLQGEHRTASQRLRSVRTLMLKNRRMTNAERDRLFSQEREVEQNLSGLAEQIAIREETLGHLTVTSPVDGQIVTWNVEELLRNRPLRRGDKLMTIAQPDGPWLLEIRMPNDRVGHILRAQNQRGGGLAVDYILTSEPGRRLSGTLVEIHDRAEVRGAEGSTVLMKVAINKDDIVHLKPGAQVVARVDCGRRSIGYVWFHEVIEFVQNKILFNM